MFRLCLVVLLRHPTNLVRRSASGRSRRPKTRSVLQCPWLPTDPTITSIARQIILIATMAAFQAVNSSLAPKDDPVEHQGEARTPTTPRPTGVDDPSDLRGTREDESTPNTPTRHSFGGLTGQRALPTSPFSSSVTPKHFGTARLQQGGTLTRENSHRSEQSTGSQDVEMDDESEGGEDGSGDESGGENGRPSKKKKGQRFFCTDFPPCTLSFTRSEHLARHIRYDTSVPVSRAYVC